jgi:hypothetical protein
MTKTTAKTVDMTAMTIMTAVIGAIIGAEIAPRPPTGVITGTETATESGTETGIGTKRGAGTTSTRATTGHSRIETRKGQQFGVFVEHSFFIFGCAFTDTLLQVIPHPNLLRSA